MEWSPCIPKGSLCATAGWSSSAVAPLSCPRFCVGLCCKEVEDFSWDGARVAHVGRFGLPGWLCHKRFSLCSGAAEDSRWLARDVADNLSELRPTGCTASCLSSGVCVRREPLILLTPLQRVYTLPQSAHHSWISPRSSEVNGNQHESIRISEVSCCVGENRAT